VKQPNVEDLQSQLSVQTATVARLSKDLQRELRVIHVLIAARAVNSDTVDKARELVDAMG